MAKHALRAIETSRRNLRLLAFGAPIERIAKRATRGSDIGSSDREHFPTSRPLELANWPDLESETTPAPQRGRHALATTRHAFTWHAMLWGGLTLPDLRPQNESTPQLRKSRPGLFLLAKETGWQERMLYSARTATADLSSICSSAYGQNWLPESINRQNFPVSPRCSSTHLTSDGQKEDPAAVAQPDYTRPTVE